MNMITKEIIEHNFPLYFTDNDVFKILDMEKYHKELHVAVEKNEIINLYKNIYALSDKYRKSKLNGFVLAQIIVPESYISCEKLLWDVGWIPEFVYDITSINLTHKMTISTPYNFITYSIIKQNDINIGTIYDDYDAGRVRKAKPLKALVDYVCRVGLDWKGIDPLIRSLRIDKECLDSIKNGDIEELFGNYTIRRAKVFLEGIRKDLHI
jgi:hypothetical protein